MFLNQKRTVRYNRRVPSAEPALSPRFARLVRESWWLLVVAALLYLGAHPRDVHEDRSRLVVLGHRRAARSNRGGVVGAWLADLLLYLFGLSAWWWVIGGVVLVVAGYRRVVRPEDETDHPLALGRRWASRSCCSSSAALEAIRLWKLPASLPLAPGGAFGDVIGQGLSRALGFNGATLLLLALLCRRARRCSSASPGSR